MSKMPEIYALKLDGYIKKNKFNELLNYVSNEKSKRIKNFYRSEDAQMTLIGDILTRFLLCNRLKVKNHELIFEANKYGKPILSNYIGTEFNISHSGKWLVCCVDDFPIGIDVEIVKPIDTRIAERFFSKKEFEDLTLKSTFARKAFFYELWTLKESYIKAIGKGLSIPLNSFTIEINEDNIVVCTIHESENYYFRQYYLDEGYKMAVCARRKEFPNVIRVIDINDLLKEFKKIVNKI